MLTWARSSSGCHSTGENVDELLDLSERTVDHLFQIEYSSVRLESKRSAEIFGQ